METKASTTKLLPSSLHIVLLDTATTEMHYNHLRLIFLIIIS